MTHSQESNKSDISSLMETDSKDGLDSSALAKLEEKIQKLEDDRIEERFLWILMLLIVIDFALLPAIKNWGSAMVIGILEIVFVIILARKFQIDEIEKIFDKILDSLSNRKN